MPCCTFWSKSWAKCKAKSRKKRRNSRNQSPLKEESNTQHDEKICLDSSSEPSTVSVSSAFKLNDPWTEAEELLKMGTETRVLLEDAFEILQKYGLKIDHGDGQSNQQLTKFLNDETRKLEERKWSIADHGTPTQDQLTTIFKNILMAKEIFAPIASLSPPAAIACAGLTVVFTLFIQYMEQKETLMQGIEKTSALIVRIHLMRNLALEYCSNPDLLDHMPKFQKILVKLCSGTLEFHARALCYFEKSLMTQISRDMVKKDSWDELLKDMGNFEREAQLFISLFQAEQSRFKEGKWELRFTNLEHDLNKYQVWNKDSAHDKKMDKLLRLLYTCPYRDRKDRNRKRVSGTCEWFTHHQEFQEWDQSEESRLLWVSADPGCGKSVLARYLVDEVLPRPKDRTVCYFFFKDDFEDQRTATAALSSLIRQLLLGQPSLLSEAILKQAATDGEKLPHSFQDLWEIFKAIISSPSVGEIVFVIDALDECQDTDRHHFIDSVTELYLKPDNSRTPKILMTSRPYLKIEDGFHRLRTKVPIIRLNGEDEENIEKIAKEINLVVQDLTQKIAAEKNLDPDEHGFLQEQLAKIPNQTYLWVTLTLDYIAKTPGFTKGNVRRCLSTEIPPDVNQAYEKILNRSTNYTKARLMLHIILAAKTPLSLEELSVSLALNGTNQSADQLKEEMEPPERFKRTVRDLCGLMLHLNNGKVYLLHQTVKEFLVGNSPSGHPTWQNSFLQNTSEKLLAKRCIWMLHLGPSDPNLTHLNRYAARYWSEHFRGFDSCKEDKITSLALQLCDPDSRKFRDWNPTLCQTWNHKDENQAFSTSLMVASCLGLEGVVEKLLSDQSVDISLNSPRGDMPAIRFAVYEGHHAVVKRLLDSGQVDVNLRDRDQQTLLSLAASRGHEATVTLLLKTKNVIVDSQDIQYRTPLSHAAANGREGAVKLLLEDSRVNPNLKDRKEQAPLLNAAKSRRTGVAKLLLKNFRVDVNTTDQEQRTPLSHAAENGDEAMVELLLRHEKVKPDLPDHWDVTPLAYAAEYGQSAIIKPLFETGLVDVNSKSKDDKTPLLFAIFSGSAATVRQLLETRQVDLDVTDQRDRTALDLARLHCRDDIADILLGLDADTSGVGSVGAADLLSNGRSNEAHRISGVKQDTITHP